MTIPAMMPGSSAMLLVLRRSVGGGAGVVVAAANVVVVVVACSGCISMKSHENPGVDASKGVTVALAVCNSGLYSDAGMGVHTFCRKLYQ